MERVSFDRNIVQYYGACLDERAPLLVMECMAVRAMRCAPHALSSARLFAPTLCALTQALRLLPPHCLTWQRQPYQCQP